MNSLYFYTVLIIAFSPAIVMFATLTAIITIPIAYIYKIIRDESVYRRVVKENK